MTTKTHSTRFLPAVVEIFGIAIVRFRLLPRLWVIWLVAINSLAILFIDRPEAVVTLAVVAVAVVIQALIYQKLGFVRLLGIAHLLWIPMLLWFTTRLDTALSTNPELGFWMLLLMLTNLISLLVDGVDVTRYLRGEKAPHYAWRKS